MKPTKLFFLLFLCFGSLALRAQVATIKGVIKDPNGNPLQDVNIKVGNRGVVSNENGAYSLDIKAKENVIVEFSHIQFQTIKKRVKLGNGKTLNYSPKMREKVAEIENVVIKNRKKDAQGIITLDPKIAQEISTPNKSVEQTLMTFGGVNNNNELSTQYNVRGGNFDENLVYVNGIEVYRPFLIRSGQQEGLSFVNVDLTDKVYFSAGGFQAKYGDKLSSVLDITYRKPEDFSARGNLSLLGGSAAVEGKLFNDKLSAIVGVRYRDNSLLVNSKDIETNFRPRFADIQTYLSYQVNDKLNIDFLGNFSLNKYNYTPITRRTRFGTLSNPLELIVFYNGNEQDDYQTMFGAVKVDYKVNDDFNLSLTTSTYNTQEEEYYDILASYNLGEVNNSLGDEDFGEVEFSEGIGSQLNHARNELDALISNLQLRANYKVNKHVFDAGIKYQTEDIRDRIIEWEVIDSAGFAVRPPTHTISNNQPYEPYEGPLEAYQNVRARNNTTIDRISGFAQWSYRTTWGESKVWLNAGGRFQNWTVKGDGLTSHSQTVFSPRAQFAIKPDWENDMLFRFATGLYYQPPFYRELRDRNGQVIPTVKAQNSLHFIAGMDYSFDMWERPFKLTTEAYYKDFKDVNPYTVDNVRIRYEANNNAEAYAYGLDVRLNGEFVPGTESWFTFGYLKTEENIDNQGFIARPTDQRLKFGVLFQDYVPNIPKLKMYLNLVYNTGVPGGSPSYANKYQYQTRLNAYRRADVGLSYVFKDQKHHSDARWLGTFKELALGVEIFNMFDIRNSITNTWVRDVYSKRSYAIPNYMTGRIFNVKLDFKF